MKQDKAMMLQIYHLQHYHNNVFHFANHIAHYLFSTVNNKNTNSNITRTMTTYVSETENNRQTVLHFSLYLDRINANNFIKVCFL